MIDDELGNRIVPSPFFPENCAFDIVRPGDLGSGELPLCGPDLWIPD